MPETLVNDTIFTRVSGKGEKRMEDIDIIKRTLKKNNGIITTKEVESLEINSKILTRMIEKGIIERVERGIYISADTLEDKYFVIQTICKKGIFSHETALYFHDLCDRTPIKYQLTIPSYYNTKLLKDKNYDFFYLKEELYEVGIIEMKTPYGNKVKVYDLERTICDIIRNKRRIETALFTDAMKRYAERRDRNSIKLHKYAKLFNIEDEIRKYLEVLL